jgi:hypothetical protein
MAAHRPVSRFELGVATAIVAATIVMASSFSYFFLGPIPMWLALGIVGLGFAALYGRLSPIWQMAAELRWTLTVWCSLILISGFLDLFGDMPRDIMGGAMLNLVTLSTFVGLAALATFTDNRRVVAVIITVAAFQALLGIAQFFGSSLAWQLPDLIASVLPMARIEYDVTGDMLLLSFEQVGRVRGSQPFVHLYNQIQALLVSFCLMVALTDNGISFGSRLRNVAARGAIGLAVIGVFLSFSRSGILAIIASGAVALFLNPKPSRILAASIGGAMILFALVYLGFSDSAQFYRLTQGLDEGNTNLDRFSQYELAWDNFVNNPLIGASGPNGFPDLALPIHSVPMRYLNDYGLIGFVLYMIVFGGVVKLFVRRLKSSSPIVRAWAGCGVSALCVVVIDSWTHSSGFLRRDLLQTVMLGFIAGAMLSAEWRAGLGQGRIIPPSSPRLPHAA